MKALVLGGTRFVGLRLVRLLMAEGHDVTVLNRGKTPPPNGWPAGVNRLYADRRDPAAVRGAVAGHDFDVVFDITGYDVRGVEPVAQTFSGRILHYVFQSTCGVYRDCETIPILEDFPRVASPAEGGAMGAYVFGKVLCEDYLLKAGRDLDFPVTILRSPEIYGPENWMHEREFSFFVRVLQGRTVLVPGDGRVLLHFVHVDDVAHAHLAAAGAGESGVFNIAGPDAVTANGYLDIIAGACGVGAVTKYIPAGTVAKLDKPVFPFRYDRSLFYGTALAKERLGFVPKFGIADGLRDTYEWWQANPGIAGTRLEPGRAGCNVDLAYEESIARST